MSAGINGVKPLRPGAVDNTVNNLLEELVSRVESVGSDGYARRTVTSSVERFLLSDVGERHGSGSHFDQIDWKTPMGELLIALTLGGYLSEDIESAPDAWQQFGEAALETFARDLYTIVEANDPTRCEERTWGPVRSIAYRMRAASIVHRRLFEARFGMSPHWGGQGGAATNQDALRQHVEELTVLVGDICDDDAAAIGATVQKIRKAVGLTVTNEVAK